MERDYENTETIDRLLAQFERMKEEAIEQAVAEDRERDARNECLYEQDTV
jgi:hypothetical protein